MTRKVKIITLISVMVLSLSVIGGSIYFAKNDAKNNSQINQNSNRNEMGGGFNNRNNDMRTPPDQNPNENNNNNNNNTDSNEQPSDDSKKVNDEEKKQKTDNNETTTDNNQNSNEMRGNNGNGAPPDMPRGNGFGNDRGFRAKGNITQSKLSSSYIIIISVASLVFSICLLYLIMTNFCQNDIKNSDKKLILFLASLIIAACLTFGVVKFSNDNILNSFASQEQKIDNQTNSNIKASGNSTFTTDTTEKNKTYSSSTSDESAILVKDKANLTISGATITKKGDSTNIENSEFYGINAAFLTQANSKTNITSSKITTNSKGSNAIFATGENSKVTVSDTSIETVSDSSRGLDATYEGEINASNVKITTNGNSSATLATDRGEGTITATKSTLKTNGKGSPIIYSTGNITLTDSKGEATSSQMVVVEGKNSATIKNSNLTATAIGNRDNVDNAGVMIYQSMSGDASTGVGTFKALNSSLTIPKNSKVYDSAPMFFITNTTAKINLKNTKLSYGSNLLISIKGTEEWGNANSNGGELEFNSTDEELVGDIILDNLSILNLNLKNSTYKGTINSDNKAKNIKLVLDKNSKITLTGDSYISSLETTLKDYSNINFNGYKLYVNGKSIN